MTIKVPDKEELMEFSRGCLIPVFAAVAIDVAVAAASLKLVDMLVGGFW